ncbi:MAG: helix-turn-helix domain-containing protein [Planctomycetaceae bacterium]
MILARQLADRIYRTRNLRVLSPSTPTQLRHNWETEVPAESLLDAERLTINAAAKRLDTHVSTVWRWVTRGCRGRKLPTLTVGARRFVLVADLEAFLQAGRDADPSVDAGQQSFAEAAADADAKLAAIL